MPLRVLMISSCFPHPENAGLGVWAQFQANALVNSGVALKIVSPTSYVPQFVGNMGIGSWAANSPAETRDGPLDISFPRWFYHYVGPMRPVIRRWPGPVFSAAWPHLKRALLEEIARHQPDVIFANHSLDGGESARRLKELTGIPFVVAEHDFGEITDCARFPSRRHHYQQIFDAASSVLAVSERMKADILALFPTARVVVARFGREPIPEDFHFRPRPKDLSGKTVIFSASGLFERKGVPLLIEAFSKIAPRHPDAVLRIAGDGHERAKVEQAVKIHDRTGQVQLLGRLAHDEVLQEMAWADAFALTGWDEPFATVYVEALASGLPIVCCNDGGICDILEDGVHGLTVPPRDLDAATTALERLIEDPALRRRMSQAALNLFKAKLTTESYTRVLCGELTRATQGASPTLIGPKPETSIPKRIKVLHLCQRDDPGTGGAARVAAEYVKRLPQHRIDARLVFVYGPPGPFNEELPGRCIHLEGRDGNAVISNSIRLLELIRTEKPDIIHHHDGLMWTHLAGLLSRTVITIGHGHLYATPPIRTIRNVFACWLQRHTYDLSVCVSEAVGRSWEDAGTEKKKIRIIENGVDVETFTPATPEERHRARVQFQIPPQAKVMAFAGRLDNTMKGCDDFLRILAALPHEFHGLLAGDGPDLNALRSLAGELGIDDRIHFAGLLHPTTPCYHAADLLLLTSHYEPFGLVIVEALSCGLPVVTLPCEGGAESLTRQAGEIVLQTRDPNQVAKAIIVRMDDATTISKTTVSQRHILAKTSFSWDVATVKLVKEYSRLANHEKRSNTMRDRTHA